MPTNREVLDITIALERESMAIYARFARLFAAAPRLLEFWFGLAREIFLLLGTDPDRVRRAASAAFPRPVPRPAYSVLGHARHALAGLEPIADWRLALYRAWPTLAVRQRIGSAS